MVLKVTCVVLMLLLPGCAPRTMPTATRADPNLQIVLTTQPESPRQMDPTHFTVTLRDAQGQPVTGATARLDLRMTTMDMGQDQVPLFPRSPGASVGTGRFSMPGFWRMTVTATKGSEQAVQSFPITVR